MLESPTPSLRMDGHHMTERILDLILEILYKLTGEDCEVVKMASGQRLTSSSCWHRLPPVGHPTPDRYNKKILEVTNKVIELLMSEAKKLMESKDESDEEETCVKSDQQYMEEGDPMVTVKKEEKETCLRDDQQTIKDEELDMMGTTKEEKGETSLIAGQLSVRKGYTMVKIKEEETCVRGDQQTMGEEDMMETIKEEEEETYRRAGRLSTEEGTIKFEEETCLRGDRQTTEEEADMMGTIKEEEEETSIMTGELSTGDADMMGTTEVKEEEMCVMEYQQSMEDGDVKRTIKEEEFSPNISTAGGHDVGDTSEGHLISHPNVIAEDNGVTQCSPGGFPVGSNVPCLLYIVDRPSDPSRTTPAAPSSLHLQILSADGRPDSSNAEGSSSCKWNIVPLSDLMRHMKALPGVKPCPPPRIGKAFTNEQELSVHQKNHARKLPFACSQCGERFKLKSELIRHKKVPIKERPFSCFLCGESFTTNIDLNKHEKRHERVWPYPCSECGKCFPKKMDLSKHQKGHKNGSSNRKPARKPRGSLNSQNSPRKDRTLPHRHQVAKSVKLSVKKQKEPNLRGDQKPAGEKDMVGAIIEEENETCVRGDHKSMKEGDMMKAIKEDDETYMKVDHQSTDEGGMTGTNKMEDEACVGGDQKTMGEEGDIMVTSKEQGRRDGCEGTSEDHGEGN